MIIHFKKEAKTSSHTGCVLKKDNDLSKYDILLILDFITLGKIETKSMMNSYDFKIQATTICRPSSLNSKNKNFLKLDSGARENDQGCLYSPVLKKNR